MIERPILFSGPMVRALLEGRKNQTRRVVKPPRRKVAIWGPQDSWVVDPGGTAIFGPGPYVKMNWWHKDDVPSDFDPGVVTAAHADYRRMDRVRCPYGYHDDRLWVRESWCQRFDSETEQLRGYFYRATDHDVVSVEGERADGTARSPWRTSVHMPRSASRLTLRLIEVRCERLQSISPADIRLEGIDCPEHDFAAGFCHGECPTLRATFAQAWDRLNDRPGRRWEDDPLVWALCFEREAQAGLGLRDQGH